MLGFNVRSSIQARCWATVKLQALAAGQETAFLGEAAPIHIVHIAPMPICLPFQLSIRLVSILVSFVALSRWWQSSQIILNLSWRASQRSKSVVNSGQKLGDRIIIRVREWNRV